MRASPRSTARRARADGFSLIELMVSMVIALVVTLAITTVMIRSGNDRRTSSSVNDVNQTGTYVSYVLDRAVRSAGSGFAQNWTDVVGCRINAKKDNVAVLPSASAFPAPFAAVPQTVRLIPVLIGKGQADTPSSTRGDTLTLIAGTGGFGELAQDVRAGTVTGTTIGLQNTLAYRAGDLVLLADPANTLNTAAKSGCLLQQVSGVGADLLTLGGQYANATGTNLDMTDLASTGKPVALQLGGNASAAPNLPTMQLFGVGNNNTLFAYDLLQKSADGAVPLAEGIVEMRAAYGVDTTAQPDGVLDSWVDPGSSTAGYTLAELNDGSAAAQTKLRRIVAIRVGLILRTSLSERDAVQPNGATITLFNDIGLTQTRTLSSDELRFRFRTVEVTIPLRNALFAPAS